MNEETFKNAIVVPFLRSAGFDSGELAFESSFTLQLGRGTHTVSGAAGGRLDILCKRDGTNLLVAELKAPSEPVDATTARQAISYARLLEPMAPFVLVSNGRESRLFDAVTSAPIDRVERQSVYRADLAADLRLRYEALLSFVGYSHENLVAFTAAQREIALRPFAATLTDAPRSQLSKKYIPALSVRRHDAFERVFRFVHGANSAVLACVGPSGCGKTVLACQMLEELPAPTLFYSGTLLGASLIAEIVLDFNLAFSAQEGEIAILRKVASLTRAHGGRLVVVVDAIDEWRAADKCAQLDRFSAIAAQLGFRIVVTCKEVHWPSFLTSRGVGRPLADNLELPVLEIGDFTNDERTEAMSRATAFLGLKPSVDVREDDSLSHPFTLRVVTEVAVGDGAASLDSVPTSSRQVLKRFLELSFAKLSAPALGQRVLVALGRLLLDQASFQCRSDVLRSELGLNVVDELPQELFLSGLLLTHADAAGEEYISFYHSHVRDYVLAILIGRLSSSDAAARKTWIARHLESSPGVDAVLYFAATGTHAEQRETVQALVEGDAARDGEAIARLLSWGGEVIARGVLEEVGDQLLDRLLAAFERAEHDTSGLAATRVVDAMCRLTNAKSAERTLVDVVERIARSTNEVIAHEMSRLGRVLQAFDSRECTARLVTVVRDRNVTGYVRRYVAEALTHRTIEDRTALFLDLVVDAEPNVLAWIRSWYTRLETTEVRDRLLAIHDAAETAYLAKEMSCILACSTLRDTGAALFARIETSKSRGWTCRAIAELGYRPAEARFIELLRLDPFSELGGNVMLAMSEMPSTAFVGPLVELLKSNARRLVESGNDTWLAQALAKAATLDELRELASSLRSTGDKDLSYCIGVTLLHADDERLHGTVLEALTEGAFGTHTDSVLSWVPILVRQSSHGQFDLLERIAGARRSVLALVVAGVAASDGARLAHLVREVLPAATDELRGRIMWDPKLRPKLRAELDEWLASRFRSVASNDKRADLLLAFAPWIGGRRTLEALRASRPALARISSDAMVSTTEHEIYRALAEDLRRDVSSSRSMDSSE